MSVRKFLTMLVGALALAVLLPASPASAAPPERLVLVVEETLPLTTDGTVISGNRCAAGSVDTVGEPEVLDDAVETFDVTKTFTCTDGSFVIELSVVLFTSTGNTIGRWTLGEGTGDYAGDTGRGLLFGVPDDDGIIDTYIGLIR